MEVNTIAKVGSDIAIFNGKSQEESKLFTSHTFRRSGASIMANGSASMEQIKIAGNWKSTGAAEGYIQKSDPMKRKIANIQAETIGLVASVESIEPVYPHKRIVKETEIKDSIETRNGMVIHNQQIFHFNSTSLDGCTFSFGTGTEEKTVGIVEKTATVGDKENQPPLVLKFSRKQALA
jgi:hypothetical protein